MKGQKYHISIPSRRDVFSLALSASHIWILGLIFCHKIFTYKDTFQVEYRASSLNRLSSRSIDAEKMSRRDDSIVLKYPLLVLNIANQIPEEHPKILTCKIREDHYNVHLSLRI